MYRLTIVAVIALALFLSLRAEAMTGLGIGARAGYYSKYDNGDLSFKDYPIIEIDKLTMLGGHIRVSTLPIFTYELVAEYSFKSQDYKLDEGPTAKLKVRDFMIGANVKYKFKIPTFKPYIGGGFGMHQLTYELGFTGSGAGDLSVILPKDGPRLGVHGLAGVELSFPMSPIEVFLEWRAGRISGADKRTDFTMFYGGITLKML